MYKIGELAKAAGISIRTLRYYDEIGLLKPAEVTEAGYRFYTKENLTKLQHITALKALGFKLLQIRDILNANDNETQEVRYNHALKMQIAEIQIQKAHLTNLERILTATLHSLEIHGDLQAEDIFMFIREVQRGDDQRLNNLRKLFTKKELDIMLSLPALDADDERTRRWTQLLREVRDNLHEPPSSPVSQQLALRLLECGLDFYQGDYQLLEKHWELSRPEEGQAAKISGLDRETMHYIDSIIDWYLQNKEKGIVGEKREKEPER